jgi:CO/xanthine dehydrogenase Mo-binding subunit
LLPRTAHLREPVGPQIQFASESFIDEIVAVTDTDLVTFRLRYLAAPRDTAVVKAAAERAGWQPHPSPRLDCNGDTLVEEVAFDRDKVSVDWLSYPTFDIAEAPEAADIVLINHPELPPAGAGESSIRPVAATLANTVFDATGVGLRRAPLTRNGSSRC